MMNSAIKTENLSIGYRKDALITDIGLTLQSGVVTAMLGANGAGKSTLLRTLSGELPAIGGKVLIMGRLLNKYTKNELARTVALVTTDRVTCGGLTVRQTVTTGRYPYVGRMARLSAEDRNIVEMAMKNVGIIHKADAVLSELSDGERQKCFIAKALAQSTPIIMLDEPFSFLDTAARIEMFQLLKQIALRDRKAILLSSHDVTQAVRMASFLWIIDAGGRLSEGTPEEMVDNGVISNIFKSESVIYDKAKNDFILKS